MVLIDDVAVESERIEPQERAALIDVGRLVFWTFAAGMVAVAGGLMVFHAMRRPPWIDELATHYFVTSPGDFLDRYHGDPHPVGYYLPLIPLAQVSQSVAFLRVVGLVVPTAAAVALSLASTLDRRQLRRHLLLIAPAACGSALFVEWGADLRMYGALGICSAVLAVTVYHWLEDPTAERRTVAAMAGLLTLVACLHVWGALIAATYGAIVLGRLWMMRAAIDRTAVEVFGLLAVVVTTAAYVWGPPFNAERPIPFSDREFAWMLVSGLSSSVGVVAAIGVVWLIASTFTDSRRATMIFDVPMVVVVLCVWLVSQVQPIAKTYSPTPVVVVFVTGLLVRLAGRVPWLASVTVIALFIGNVSTLRGLGDERESFDASTSYLLDHYDGNCPVLVFPAAHELHSTRHFVDLPLLPLTDAGVAEACPRGWVIANHANGSTELELERIVSAIDVEADFGDAFVGRYSLD